MSTASSSVRIALSSSYRSRTTRTLPAVGFPNHIGRQLTSCNRCGVLDKFFMKSILGGAISSFELRVASLAFQRGALAALGGRAERPSQTPDLAVSSAVLAFILGFVAATSSPGTESSASIQASAAKFNRPDGGGGGSGPLRSVGIISKKAADDDVKKIEEESKENPYPVSEGAEQGARWTMEDAYTVETGGRFVGVFDGHGGCEVSKILQDRLHGYYRNLLASKHWEERDDFDSSQRRIPSISSHVAALRGALEMVEEDVIKEDHLVYQGSTAVIVVVHVAEDGRRTLLSANIGDSRAILSRKRKAVDLTRDHKPNDEREKARIRAHGEDIEWDPYGEVYRVRDLSLSRVIGDRFAKPVVCNEPEIKHFPVDDEKDEFILLGSDGLFDVMESQEVVDFVHETLEQTPGVSKQYLRQMMAKSVANEALERGTADNVCVVMVWL